jgi:hypothetical protein
MICLSKMSHNGYQPACNILCTTVLLGASCALVSQDAATLQASLTKEAQEYAGLVRTHMSKLNNSLESKFNNIQAMHVSTWWLIRDAWDSMTGCRCCMGTLPFPSKLLLHRFVPVVSADPCVVSHSCHRQASQSSWHLPGTGTVRSTSRWHKCGHRWVPQKLGVTINFPCAATCTWGRASLGGMSALQCPGTNPAATVGDRQIQQQICLAADAC